VKDEVILLRTGASASGREGKKEAWPGGMGKKAQTRSLVQWVGRVGTVEDFSDNFFSSDASNCGTLVQIPIYKATRRSRKRI
jgi:hypothetical protein